MTLSSGDISDGRPIPAAQIHPRCGGRNLPPALFWSGAPAGTRSFALTMIDLDVTPSGWSHWLVVDLQPNVTFLARGAKILPLGARGIVSNFGGTSYDGPCPPAGSGTHHYRLTVWALPIESLPLAADAKASDVTNLLDKLALDHASITGTVGR
jgi:Raf kinase inhibitor-like YbhB/YbcL family protein